MTILHSIILGIVEGFTEFLPISSTAHLILASKLLGMDQSSFVKTFEIAIQSGAIFAVILIYWKKFFDLEMLKRIIVAFIPTGIIGLAVYKIVKSYLIGNITVVLWSLALGGLALIIFEKFLSRRNETQIQSNDIKYSESSDTLRPNEVGIKDISYARVALIGVFQAIAVIPGVSRSAATIVGGRLLGLGREAVVEFSFLLAVPTILAATGLDVFKNIHSFNGGQSLTLFVGFIVSFLTAILGIRFLLSYIRKHSFITFGFYRIVLVIVFIIIGYIFVS